jgi:hypothetical protein
MLQSNAMIKTCYVAEQRHDKNLLCCIEQRHDKTLLCCIEQSFDKSFYMLQIRLLITPTKPKIHEKPFYVAEQSYDKTSYVAEQALDISSHAEDSL